MMSRLVYATLILTVILYPGTGRAGLFGPSNYDQCITESMKGVSSDVAARAIISSCRNQFPAEAEAEAAADPGAAAAVAVAVTAEPGAAATEPAAAAAVAVAVAPEQQETTSESSRSLTADELRKLTTRAFIFANTYSLSFENKNDQLTITEVTIAVEDKSDPDSLREYRQNVRIAPLGSGSAKYTVVYVGDEANWAWHVASAKGIE
jgi:hypothetical protein